jgi:catechol 2,3-dioxygenase-like lactoylglutathione lyase family enzyme
MDWNRMRPVDAVGSAAEMQGKANLFQQPGWPRRSLRSRGLVRLSDMSVERVVADLTTRSLEHAKAFYERVLGLEPVMDHGWIITLANPDRPGTQISLATHDKTAPVVPNVSVQVDDVDAAYLAAVREGAEIVHPLSDEPWGVRRFFVRDPDGHVINVLSHR